LGNFLLSHTLARAVPSGLKGLTSVFGMGTGGSPSLQSPKTYFESARTTEPATAGPARANPPQTFASIRVHLRPMNIDGPTHKTAAANSMPTENFMVKPNGLLVTVSSTYYYASTSVLSTWSSSTALLSFRLGNLISGKVSRLYAFSAYPDQTSLPSYATGVTTGSQEVCSTRSSRTRVNPPQISCAHHR
jgi:hypothetical protein